MKKVSSSALVLALMLAFGFQAHAYRTHAPQPSVPTPTYPNGGGDRGPIDPVPPPMW